MAKERLDVMLVGRGLCESRTQAKAFIMAGEVFVDGQREDKAGATFPEEVSIEIRGKKMPYVSRGGFKLEKALEVFPIGRVATTSPEDSDGTSSSGGSDEKPLRGLICMDVGSSTGGFTDCMLQNGAARVYAIDVGTNQLAWKLRQDERVVVMEKTNIRYVTPEDMQQATEKAGLSTVSGKEEDDSATWKGVDFVSIDVAFISLEKVFTPVRALMKETAQVVALIKPQFEAGREQVGKKGVVRDPKIHEDVIRRVSGYATAADFSVCGLDHSPIRGPEGNIEYLLFLKCGSEEDEVGSWDERIREIVSQAHETL